jgi:hypothetical protein
MTHCQQNRIDSILDAELAWVEFCRDVVNEDDASNQGSRYCRINPDIGRKPPSMDDVGKLKKLQQDTRKQLKTLDSRAQISRVARILVASSFFYEVIGDSKPELDGSFSCTGLSTLSPPPLYLQVLIV